MNRRTFMHTAGAAGLGLGSRPGRADTGESGAGLLQVLEDSSRERLPHELARLVRSGLRHEDLLAAVSLAAARDVQPYPDVGFKYHVVMMLRSIHSTVAQGAPAERWLPLFWAADYFKSAQAQERAAGGWRMPARPAVSESDPQAARRALVTALDHWDRDAADAAIVSYARIAHPDEVFAALFPYGARDLRAIGHKAIEVSNAHYLISVLGAGEHVEPILRSTVAALQNSDEDRDPDKHDFAPDRPWRKNREISYARPGELPAPAELRAALYRSSEDDAGAVVAGFLQRGVSAAAVWEVLSNIAAELLLLRPGIVPLHAQTTTNALHYAARVCGEQATQQMMLLQCAAFIAMFRKMMNAGAARLDLSKLQPAPVRHRDEIFAELAAGRRLEAARKTLGYLESGGDATSLIATVRHHMVHGADEPHDYKLTEAVIDTSGQLPDPAAQQRFLSAGMAYFKAPTQQPTAVISNALELLRT